MVSDDLAGALETVARTMQAAPSPHDTVAAITEAAVELIAVPSTRRSRW